jgi:hypothetical protein
MVRGAFFRDAGRVCLDRPYQSPEQTMRIWDLHPGFLNRQSLLGEHREIHAIHAILSQGKKGYSRHPETLRWRGRLAALWLRHQQVAAEMRLRGFNHFSPLPAPETEIVWPETFIDAPARQFALLAEKYAAREQGRIPLPVGLDELLFSHALSLTCRGLPAEKQPGTAGSFAETAEALVRLLRRPPTEKGMAEVLAILGVTRRDEADLLAFIRQEAGLGNQTAVLSELLLWPEIYSARTGSSTAPSLSNLQARISGS